jgi:hypothetical protein
MKIKKIIWWTISAIGMAFVLFVLLIVYGLSNLLAQENICKTKSCQYNYAFFITHYYEDLGIYPSRIEDLNTYHVVGGTNSVPVGDKRFVDAWGARMLYVRRSNSFSIISAGTDGRFYTPDDIVTNVYLAK